MSAWEWSRGHARAFHTEGTVSAWKWSRGRAAAFHIKGTAPVKTSSQREQVSVKVSGRRESGKEHGSLWEAELVLWFENEFQLLFKNKTVVGNFKTAGAVTPLPPLSTCVHGLCGCPTPESQLEGLRRKYRKA